MPLKWPPGCAVVQGGQTGLLVGTTRRRKGPDAKTFAKGASLANVLVEPAISQGKSQGLRDTFWLGGCPRSSCSIRLILRLPFHLLHVRGAFVFYWTLC